jgi:hypothetical protein
VVVRKGLSGHGPAGITHLSGDPDMSPFDPPLSQQLYVPGDPDPLDVADAKDGSNVRKRSHATSFTLVPIGDHIWHIPTVAVDAIEAGARRPAVVPFTLAAISARSSAALWCSC